MTSDMQQDENTRVYHFFDLVFNCELGDLDIYNYIQNATSNFNINKLTQLFEDLEYYTVVKRDDISASYSEEDMINAIYKFHSNNKEIPYMHIRELPFTKIKPSKPNKIIDKEKLLFPYDLFTLYKLASQIKTFIDEKEGELIERPKSKIVAICAFFLSESKYIEHSSAQQLSEKVLTLFKSNYKASTILKHYNNIKSKNIDEILTPVNIQIAIPYLSEFPKAQKLAQDHLNTIEFV